MEILVPKAAPLINFSKTHKAFSCINYSEKLIFFSKAISLSLFLQ